jgi:hypothetical protein
VYVRETMRKVSRNRPRSCPTASFIQIILFQKNPCFTTVPESSDHVPLHNQVSGNAAMGIGQGPE